MIDKSVKILLWDIETLPHVGLHWGMWKQNIQPGAIVQQSEMLCLSYKWLGSRRVFNISPINQPGFKDNPYAFSDYICKEFIPVLETCDFAVAHNGDNFDYRKLKAYTVINNLQPFRARKVDTLRMAKSIGMFPKGNRLDSLAEVLGVEQKNKTDFGMWKDIALCKKNMMEQMQKQHELMLKDDEEDKKG